MGLKLLLPDGNRLLYLNPWFTKGNLLNPVLFCKRKMTHGICPTKQGHSERELQLSPSHHSLPEHGHVTTLSTPGHTLQDPGVVATAITGAGVGLVAAKKIIKVEKINAKYLTYNKYNVAKDKVSRNNYSKNSFHPKPSSSTFLFLYSR